jgi:hypothetical protein
MVNIEGKKIFQLEEEEGIIVGQDNLKTFISEFFKNLFGPPSPNHFQMLESVNNDIPQLFPAEFYQKIWEAIKSDLMAMFDAFERHELPLYHLNFGTIILLSKKENAIQIQQYRPIFLLNVFFKIFTKVGTNRVATVAHSVVIPTQTAFMSGRHILEGVVVLHETIHELHRKKMDGVLLKIDFEKAYDKVR